MYITDLQYSGVPEYYCILSCTENYHLCNRHTRDFSSSSKMLPFSDIITEIHTFVFLVENKNPYQTFFKKVEK